MMTLFSVRVLKEMIKLAWLYNCWVSMKRGVEHRRRQRVDNKKRQEDCMPQRKAYNGTTHYGTQK